MKKSLVAIVVGLALSAMAQTAPQTTAPATGQQTQPMTPAQPAPGQSAQPAAAQPAQAAGQPCRPVAKKEIKDPAEYNSYTTSLNAADPKTKILGFENFVRLFPNSAYKEDALEQLMTAYQQAGDTAKMVDAAKQLLQVNPNNVRALAILAYLARANAGQPGTNLQQAVADARTYGEKGLQALDVMPCPEGASPADVEKLKGQTGIIFHESIGFAALQSKDFAGAQQNFLAAVGKEPPTAQDSLNDVYNLGVAYLEPKPMNPLGLWYIARAVALSNNNAQIASYGRSKYRKFHGGEDGWDQLLSQAKAATSNTPPQNFAVAPAPTPAEIARNLANTKDPKDMDLGEIETVLQNGDPASAQKVWEAIKEKPIKFPAVVLSASRTELSLGATEDAIQSKKPDVVITTETPMAAKDLPKVGAQVELLAVPVSYDPPPNFLIHMKPSTAAAKPPAKKPSPGKRRTTTR